MSIPTYVWPFVLAVIAVVAGRMLAGDARQDPRTLPGWILYAIAAGCVVIGMATWWLDHAT